jgi:hypothetical protein
VIGNAYRSGAWRSLVFGAGVWLILAGAGGQDVYASSSPKTASTVDERPSGKSSDKPLEKASKPTAEAEAKSPVKSSKTDAAKKGLAGKETKGAAGVATKAPTKKGDQEASAKSPAADKAAQEEALAKARAAEKAAQDEARRRAALAEAKRAEEAARLRTLGAMSVGLANTGVLVNAVRMPQGEDWVITVPSHAYGTEETVRQLGQCITATRAEHPGSPRVMLGSLSGEQGGHLPPHKSHRTGRDVDVYFFRKPGATWSKAATLDDIDLPRTWSLLRCFVSTADVEMVLIDKKVQGWLEHYALSIGEPPEWIERLFHDKPHTKSAMVRHVPGHVAHMHVRFVSGNARRLGAKHYQDLVKAGLLKERVEEVRHTVTKGDTLIGLAKRYGLSVSEVQELNKLSGTVIRLGQVLLMKQGVPIEGVTAPIYAPGRSLPPEPCEAGPKVCHAGLALVERPVLEPFVGEDAQKMPGLLSAQLH